MKKLHLLVGVFIFIGCLQVHAEKSRVAMEKWQTGNYAFKVSNGLPLVKLLFDIFPSKQT